MVDVLVLQAVKCGADSVHCPPLRDNEKLGVARQTTLLVLLL